MMPMVARTLEATKVALSEYRTGRNIARLARKHGIARNTLWRAIRKRAIKRANNGTYKGAR